MRLLREPFIQFIIIGCLIYALYNLFSQHTPQETIFVGAVRQEALGQELREMLGREPGREELAAHIGTYVEREILFRSAINLRLDRDDPVVRRRLIQKMRFLLEIEPAQISVNEEEIRAYFGQNRERYTRQERVSFQQVFIGDALPDGFESAGPAELAIGLELEQGTATFVKPFPLDSQFIDVPVSNVASDFGDDFSKALILLEPGQWHGPLKSRYGLHFARLNEYLPEALSGLDNVRGLVMRDLKKEKLQQAEAAEMDKLRENFSIVIETEGGQAGSR